MKSYNIGILGGDGIGPEVMRTVTGLCCHEIGLVGVVALVFLNVATPAYLQEQYLYQPVTKSLVRRVRAPRVGRNIRT